MNLLKYDTRKLYVKFLSASFGSSLAVCIYSFVDTVAVGQFEGSRGAAAMAVISPLYGLIIFVANLCGLGGMFSYDCVDVNNLDIND